MPVDGDQYLSDRVRTISRGLSDPAIGFTPLFASKHVLWQHAEFFFKGLGEIAEIGKTDIVSYLFYGKMASLQHLPRFFQAVAVIELIEFHAIDLLEFRFELGRAHHGSLRKHLDGRKFIQFVIAQHDLHVPQRPDILFFVL